MDRLLKLAAVAAALLVAVPACGKKDKDKDKNKPAPSVKTDPTPTPPPEPPKVTGEALVKKYQECWAHLNAKHADMFKACYAEDAESELLDSGMDAVKGRDAIVQRHTDMVSAFSDWKGTPQLIVLSGNQLFAVAHVAGTHDGVLKMPTGEVPATKKKMGMLIGHGVTFNDKGEATREWVAQDMGTFMGQLGLHKMPTRPAMDKGWTETAEVVIASDSQPEKDNLAAFGKQMEAWNAHDAKALEAGIADDAAQHISALPKDAKGKAELVAAAQGYWKAFPDVKVTHDTTVAAGDYVVAVGSATGTNKGAMAPFIKKPTNKSATVKLVQVVKLSGGKMASEWAFYNGAALAMQLGLIPMPKTGAAEPAKGEEPAKAEPAKEPAKKEPAKKEPAKAEPTPGTPGATPPK